MSDLSGITLERIYARCEEVGDCRLWQGALSKAKGKDHWGTPCISVPVEPGKRKTVPVRRVVYQLAKGKPMPSGLVGAAKCGNRLCVSEHCVRAVTNKLSKQIAAKHGAFNNPAKIRKGTLTRRAQSRITEEMVQAAKDARTGKEAASLTGISLSYAKAIRRGAARRDYSSPFAGLLAG